MELPANAAEMKARGYRFLERGVCDGCGKPVEWWRTPQHLEIPMNPMFTEKYPAESHWETCAMVLAERKTG